ncbi:MAG TPA: RNA polymerase sigma factor [Kofleriaceae bacterium]
METRQQRLRRLLEPLHDRAQAFARSLARSRADGDDLFQEALVRALDKVDALREDRAFRGWLYRVIVSVHRNRYRRGFWQRLLPLTNEPASDDATEANLGASQRARLALASLPHEQREAIVLHDIEGWRIEEIAELEGASVSAIKSRLSRGRERLRDIYARKFAMRAEASLVPGESP